MSASSADVTVPDDYEPLESGTLSARLGALEVMRERVGDVPANWVVEEVGDGNLNLVFIVTGSAGSVVVKQALPYVRLVGESWPLPLDRAFFEYHALTRQYTRSPGIPPAVLHFDRDQALIVMEYLAPHRILRHSLMSGTRHDGLGETLGRFCAETLFRGSDLGMDTGERKADVALFAGNVALCDITENLVFDEPYFDAPMNGETPAALQTDIDALRGDTALRIAVQDLKHAFCSHAESLLHGDLHTGSIMAHEAQVRVIDPEFALYGPMGFDVGMLLANFHMAWFAQPGHGDDRTGYREWIEAVTVAIWDTFASRFTELWQRERRGILYPTRLFEALGDDAASDRACRARLDAIFADALGFAGVEIHRRTLGLARIVEYESIDDADLRARLQGEGLRFGTELILDRSDIGNMSTVIERLRRAGHDSH